MASKKIKAEVRINDNAGLDEITLELSPEQAVEVLEAVVSGDTLNINLVTGAGNGKAPSEKFDYAS